MAIESRSVRVEGFVKAKIANARRGLPFAQRGRNMYPRIRTVVHANFGKERIASVKKEERNKTKTSTHSHENMTQGTHTLTVSIPPTYKPCSHGYAAEHDHAVPILQAESASSSLFRFWE